MRAPGARPELQLEQISKNLLPLLTLKGEEEQEHGRDTRINGHTDEQFDRAI